MFFLRNKISKSVKTDHYGGQNYLVCEGGSQDLAGLRVGERLEDEACPVFDHRDLGVDLKTIAERHPAVPNKVSDIRFFFTYCALNIHTHWCGDSNPFHSTVCADEILLAFFLFIP